MYKGIFFPICKQERKLMSEQKKVAVIMGSDSDFPTVAGAIKTLSAYGVPFEVHIMSAHRTPEKAAEFASSAKDNGFGVIIAAAGKAAHLAGVQYRRPADGPAGI